MNLVHLNKEEDKSRKQKLLEFISKIKFVFQYCIFTLRTQIFSRQFTYLRKVKVSGKLSVEEAKLIAQSMIGPAALVYGCMPPGAGLVRKGPGFIRARSTLGQSVTEHVSCLREGHEVFIVGAAKATGFFPGTAALAAIVHMFYTSPTLGCRRLASRPDLPEWKLESFSAGESNAYLDAVQRHHRQKEQISEASGDKIRTLFDNVSHKFGNVHKDRNIDFIRRVIIEAPHLVER
jgi:hypothetical protein